MTIDTTNGYTESILTESTFITDFHNIASILRTRFNITFTTKVSNFLDTSWDFNYENAQLTLHFSILGVTLFPKAFRKATQNDNDAVTRLAQKLEEYEQSLHNLNNSLSNLFKEPPTQWGFRGDPSLWLDMQHKTVHIPMPDTAQNLLTTLHHLFHELTGQPLQPEANICLEKYNLGGMSRGMISTEFWLNTAFPLLLNRYSHTEQAS